MEKPMNTSKLVQAIHGLKKFRTTGQYDLTLSQILKELTPQETALVTEITRFKQVHIDALKG